MWYTAAGGPAWRHENARSLITITCLQPAAVSAVPYEAFSVVLRSPVVLFRATLILSCLGLTLRPRKKGPKTGISGLFPVATVTVRLLSARTMRNV